MTESEARLDDWFEALSGEPREIALALRALVRGAVRDADEVFKWGSPVYERNGRFCYVKAFAKHVNLGFWRGAELPDPAGLLEGKGASMRHVKLTSPEKLPKGALKALVKAAAELQRDGHDIDPRRNR